MKSQGRVYPPSMLSRLARAGAARLRVPVSQLSTALVTHPPSISEPVVVEAPISTPAHVAAAHAAGDPLITVVGVGGAGGNAIDNMIREGDFPRSIEFVAANTDSQALAKSLAPGKLQLGPALTSGLGTGARPDLGRQSAEESLKQLTEHLKGRAMCFITAGMGGGTGTGAAPVIARAARAMGLLTVGVVTRPFGFEGARRAGLADAGLAELAPAVDTLIVLPNEKLLQVARPETTFQDAFRMSDEVRLLRAIRPRNSAAQIFGAQFGANSSDAAPASSQVLLTGVRSITNLILTPGLINLDFADVNSVMKDQGLALMGVGEAAGDGRAERAVRAALKNPLLESTDISEARGVLVSFCGSGDLSLYEVEEALAELREQLSPDAQIIFGATFDDSLGKSLRISLVVTGLSQSADAQYMAPPAAMQMAGRLPPREPAVQRPAAATAPPRLDIRDQARRHATPAGGPSPVEGDAPQAAASAPMLPWLQPGTKVRDFFERHW